MCAYFAKIVSDNPKLAPEQVREMANTLAQQAQQRLAQKEAPADNYFGAFDGDKLIGFASLMIDKRYNYHTGYMTNLNVDPTYRGKGVADSLTDARLEFARQNDCDWVSTTVDADNTKGMITKFKNGFILSDYDIVPNQFIFRKQIKSEEYFDPKQGPLGELKELSLVDIEAIEDLMVEGYRGVDIRNIGDVGNSDPSNWVLIFEAGKK